MDFEKSLIKVVLYISSNDGVFSQEEESELIRLVIQSIPNISKQLLDSWIDEFFEEDLQLEFYCKKITDKKSQLLALSLAVQTAAADGLDLKENLALHKVMNFWNISWQEITGA